MQVALHGFLAIKVNLRNAGVNRELEGETRMYIYEEFETGKVELLPKANLTSPAPLRFAMFLHRSEARPDQSLEPPSLIKTTTEALTHQENQEHRLPTTKSSSYSQKFLIPGCSIKVECNFIPLIPKSVVLPPSLLSIATSPSRIDGVSAISL
jgi:hypothetical protein